MATSGQPSGPRPTRSAVILMLTDIGNTTWRMFVPVLGGFGLGIWADRSWNTRPWWTIIGIVIGIILTTALMARQFQAVKNDKK